MFHFKYNPHFNNSPNVNYIRNRSLPPKMNMLSIYFATKISFGNKDIDQKYSRSLRGQQLRL